MKHLTASLGAAGLLALVGLGVYASRIPSAEGAPDPHAYGPLHAAASPNASASPNKTPAPGAPGSAHPIASVNAETLAADMPDKRFDLPPLAKESIPTAKSDLPTVDEWKSAPLIEVTRRSAASRFCRVYRVREYLKVHCGMPTAGLRQLAGPTADVQIFVAAIPKDAFVTQINGGQAILPLRKNEARLIQFFRADSDGWELEPVPSVIVDASWPEGTDAPTVILR